MRRFLLLLVLLPVLAGLPACGTDDIGKQVRAQVDEAKAQVQARIERFRDRIQEVLAQLQPAVPQAQDTAPEVRSQGSMSASQIDGFLNAVMKNIDDYWTTTLRANDLPAPRVGFVIVPVGRTVATGCGSPAGADAAFYCSADDAIYIAEQFAAELYAGVARGLPGEQAGYGRAAGDFAVAYVLAHEYGHNIQQELGLFDNRVSTSAEPFELQADCLAGTWAHSVYEQGLLEPGDLEEATNTALAVGDFDVGNAQHHGTPIERRDALLTGYNSGDPSSCSRYLPG